MMHMPEPWLNTLMHIAVFCFCESSLIAIYGTWQIFSGRQMFIFNLNDSDVSFMKPKLVFWNA